MSRRLDRTASSDRHTVVVVGNGMVGQRFCEDLRRADTSDRFDIIALGEEPRPAYDRVHLSDFFSGKSAEDLTLAPAQWYADKSIDLHLSERVLAIDREARFVSTQSGSKFHYDTAVLATGSSPFVPPITGRDQVGVFVYRTLEDLEQIRAYAARAKVGAVLGGGLLGLEAAKALVDMGLDTHVIEFAPRLMPRQLDPDGGEMLARSIRELGVHVHLDHQTEEIVGDECAEKLRFADGSVLAVDMVVISAGIRPNDELARTSGLAVGERGGIVVDDALQTSDPSIYAIGECALWNGIIYGLVGPGYKMAHTAADIIADSSENASSSSRFTGADLSTKLKLLGVEVATFGEPTLASEQTRSVVFQDRRRGYYKKLLLDGPDGKLLGGILVGDASRYRELLAIWQGGQPVGDELESLLLSPAAASAGAVSTAQSDGALPDSALICSCNDVCKSTLANAVRDGSAATVSELKDLTRAGTGCGGCLPQMETLLAAELAALGQVVCQHICEHFPYNRSELLEIVKIQRLRSFGELRRHCGSGDGCEVCKPAVASILAGLWNDRILDHATIQDTNDRFLANIQRGGTYSVIPRVPGGEITADKLIALGEIAKKYDLSCKITGGQRVDLLGARVDQLPDIWQDLVARGFESGHAYGKALRTIKSCVGTSWCRFGVQDSTALAIRIEERYRGIRSPHKLKGAVSGCIRECAEAQSKDFGVIATEAGWNLYVGGNGGSQPRHAELLASDLDDDRLIQLIDRYLMYYIHSADRLTRTARWIEKLPKGVETLKEVLLEDSLGICQTLERDMQELVDSYQCEWAAVVNDPEQRARFRHFANSADPDSNIEFAVERSQKRPKDWNFGSERPKPTEPPSASGELHPKASSRWVRLASVSEVPEDGGVAVKHGKAQIALFNLTTRGAWYATQNACPHTRDMVLARGLVGDASGVAKVACPLHKKTFCLKSGVGLSDPSFRVETYPVAIRDGEVFVKLPAA